MNKSGGEVNKSGGEVNKSGGEVNKSGGEVNNCKFRKCKSQIPCKNHSSVCITIRVKMFTINDFREDLVFVTI